MGENNNYLLLIKIVLIIGSPSLSINIYSQDSTIHSLKYELVNLNLGKKIMIGLSSNDQMQGKLFGYGQTHLLIKNKNGVNQIYLSDINVLYIRKYFAGKGALISGSIGFLLGTGAGISFCKDTDAACSPTAVGLLGGTVLGAMAAIPGALVGSAFNKWQHIYPADSIIHIKENRIGIHIPRVSRSINTPNPYLEIYQVSLVTMNF